MKNPFVMMALAVAMMRASIASFTAPVGLSRSRSRVPGKRRSAGTKLSRDAANGRCAKGQPR